VAVTPAPLVTPAKAGAQRCTVPPLGPAFRRVWRTRGHPLQHHPWPPARTRL